MSTNAVASFQSISQGLLEVQAQAFAANARNDQTANLELVAAAAVLRAAALELGEPGLTGSAQQIMARVRLCAGDAAGAIADSLEGEAKLVGEARTPAALAAHPALEQLLELRKIRIEALGANKDSAGLAALSLDTIKILETRRARLHDPYVQAAFLADRTLFYEMFAFGSFKLGRWDDLLTGIDLLKARASYLKQSSPQPPSEDPEISDKLAAANATLKRAPPDGPAFRAALEQRRLLISLRAITQGENNADTVDDPIPSLQVSQVQAALAPDEAVVAWIWITRDVLVVMAFDVASVHAERLILNAAVRDELDAYVHALREQRLDPATLDATIGHLVDALLPPTVREIIAHCRRLILSPHRALHVVPFHVARNGERRLIEQCAVRYTATVGCLLSPGRSAPLRTDGGLFALGIDEFNLPGEQWPSLKQAESEVAAVAAVWTGNGLPVTTLVGSGATVAALRGIGSRFAHFRCLHIATHGASVFDREAKNDPNAARLILQDGALDALALSQLRLAADVVVLSACNSGQRALDGRGLDEYPGDDNFGLQSALFAAGAHGVIGALWPVVDDVAPLIMKALHQGLAVGQPADLALQAAVIEYLARPDAQREVFAWGPMFFCSTG